MNEGPGHGEPCMRSTTPCAALLYGYNAGRCTLDDDNSCRPALAQCRCTRSRRTCASSWSGAARRPSTLWGPLATDIAPGYDHITVRAVVTYRGVLTPAIRTDQCMRSSSDWKHGATASLFLRAQTLDQLWPVFRCVCCETRPSKWCCRARSARPPSARWAQRCCAT